MDNNIWLKGSEVIDAPEFALNDTRSGRAVSDERGNSVWEWQTQPGVYSRNISHEQLEQLRARQLRLVDPAARGVEMLLPRPR